MRSLQPSAIVGTLASAVFAVAVSSVPSSSVLAASQQMSGLGSVPGERADASESPTRGRVTLYPIPFGDPVAEGIVAGPDGAIWYADMGGNSIGRLTLAGKFTDFPDGLNGPNGIIVGPDGALWFTETTSHQIGRITTDGTITHYDNAGSYPQQITNGPDGAMWFTEFAKVGRITTTGSMTHFKLGANRTEFEGIATGADGALWITQFVVKGSMNSDEIWRLTTSGTKTAYHVGWGPYSIAAGPDGALWFTEHGAATIGRLTTSGQLSEFALPPGSVPTGIALGPDGAMWFGLGLSRGASIGRITMSGDITRYPITCSAREIAPGPDGAMWFTCGDTIGRITTN